MKYVIAIGDGMADNAVPELSGKTPLEYANIPVMDSLAKQGEIGSVRTVPQGVEPGSDSAILNILGYDPRIYFSGRSPLEAAGAGVQLEEGDISFRCNMVALEDADKPYAQKKILSHNGGSIDGEGALALMNALLADPRFAEYVAGNNITIHVSPSFRHITVQKGGSIDGFKVAPPHEHLDEVIAPYLPKGCALAEQLYEMMALAHEILNKHPVNEKRRAAGKLPANGLWFWAEGKATVLPNLEDKYGKKGFVVSAVPLVAGIGNLAGLDYKEVEGATGELDTNYEGKTDAVLEGLSSGYDFAVLHVEAPDECTHNAELEGKIQAIEWLDSRCLARLRDGLDQSGDAYRILILSDHKTLLSTRGHDADPVPYILFDSETTKNNPAIYSEKACEAGIYIPEGHTLIERLFA